MIKGLIFDKDGTLFDFNATWGSFTRHLLVSEAAGDALLLKRLATVLGYDLALNRFQPGSIVIAEPIDVVARAVLTVTGPGDLDALISRMNAFSADVPQQPAADLPALMAQLRAMGQTLGVVTNDAEAPAFRHLEDAGIIDELAFVAGYDSGHGAKPSAAPLLAFCKAVGLPPSDCAMVGDSPHDLTAGRAAGMTCIGVLTGPAARADLTQLADAVLNSIADLPAWLTHQV
ncbi:phosphoglycolate phosphatase [Loktanella atrilutea]|uniref:phosphoglycolate phosphatase n=1 Tax=Loktanella atrilutea TaxID=366533 RepID=A0A1M4SXB0_LOKAT|nr:HAD family hydrolase [Loktanella atrilutea]SHE36808.1 phosphoglycolate phosphatase [Loktanella atrilutea]